MRIGECKRLGGEKRRIRESKDNNMKKGLRRGGKDRMGESEK